MFKNHSPGDIDKYTFSLNKRIPTLVKNSDQDIIFLGQASMGIKNDLQKKNFIFYVRKEQSKKSNFYQSVNLFKWKF